MVGQVVGVPQASVGEVGGEGCRRGAGNMAEAGIDRVLVAPIALGAAGVDQDGRGAAVGHLVGGHESLGRPRRHGERCRLDGRRIELEGSGPGLDTAVEDGAGDAHRVEHPPHPTRNHASGVVVRHDHAVVGDSQPTHGVSERLRRGEWVSPSGPRRGRQVGVEVDEAGTGDVAGVVARASRAAVEVPARVADDDAGHVGGEPVGVDEWSGEGRGHRFSCIRSRGVRRAAHRRSRGRCRRRRPAGERRRRTRPQPRSGGGAAPVRNSCWAGCR